MLPDEQKKSGGSGSVAGAGPEPLQASDVRYDEWYKTTDGHFALLAQEAMVRKMTSGWPRRGRSLLEFFCGSGHFLESFWQSGFDVTGQERSDYLLAQARKRLGNVAEFTQGSPERLPFDDKAFDYVVCLGGLEFSQDPSAVLSEMFRLASLGVLLAFPNSWSLHGLGWRFSSRKGKQAQDNDFYKLISPLQVQGWLRKSGKGGKASWLSNMLGPRWSWKMHNWQGRLNLVSLPLPLGAFSLVRVDLAPALAGNQLLISNRRPLAAGAASGGLGRVEAPAKRG